MFIALIRHGVYAQPANTPSAWLPQALTQEGRAQSDQAAEKLHALCLGRDLKLDATIDCSHMRRAWETASLIAEGIARRGGPQLKVEEFAAMAERGVGAFANLTLEQIEDFVADDPRYPSLPPNWKSTSDFKLPVQGAESLLEAGERVRRHVESRAAAIGAGEMKLFVGHGASIRHAAYLMGILHFDQIAALSMHYAEPLVFERRVDTWHHIAGEWKVRTKRDRAD